MTDFSTVTETPGNRVTTLALDMVWTRYRFAAEFCRDRDVLEVACGAGQGLSFLRRHARRLVAGDYTPGLVRLARRQHGAVARLDAHQLPFADGSFDVVILYEAVYYLAEPERFFAEARRLLRPGGTLIVGSVNPEVPDFNPSPHSHHYPNARELRESLARQGFAVEVRGAFEDEQASPGAALVSLIKRVAVKLHLIPKTMRGKELLKRMFLGRLVEFPSAVDEGMATYRQPRVVAAGDASPTFRVLYAVGRLS